MSLHGIPLIVAAVTVAIGGTVQGSVGFGFALVSAPVIGLLEPRAVPLVPLLVGLPLNVVVARREHHAIDHRAFRLITAGIVVGTVVGGVVVARAPARALDVLFGALIVAAAAASAVRPIAQPSSRMLVAAGSASGAVNTIASTGGPILALLFQRRSGAEIRATLALVFLVSSVLSVGALAAGGGFDGPDAWTSLALTPFALAGVLASSRLRHVIDRAWIRPVILVFAALSGIGALVKGLG